MRLLELPLGRNSGEYEVKIPPDAIFVGVGLAKRDDLPALLLLTDEFNDPSKLEDKKFIVVSTLDDLKPELAEKVRNDCSLYGYVSGQDTPSWCVFGERRPSKSLFDTESEEAVANNASGGD